ncbi:MAG TPA: Flp family type IVb pilin [Abditibacteriaceae bacterium]
MLSRLVFEEEGQALVEYALIISLMALVIVITLRVFSGGVKNMYTDINDIRLNTSTQ